MLNRFKKWRAARKAKKDAQWMSDLNRFLDAVSGIKDTSD